MGLEYGLFFAEKRWGMLCRPVLLSGSLRGKNWQRQHRHALASNSKLISQEVGTPNETTWKTVQSISEKAGLATDDEKRSLARIPLTFQLFCELINVVIHTSTFIVATR